MRIEPGEFRARPLLVHALLHDVPLEDAWAVPLSGGGAGRTVQELRAVMLAGREAAPAVVQRFFGLRRRIGTLFGWDGQRPDWNAESYANRLSPEDLARSCVAPGTGVFVQPVHRFPTLYMRAIAPFRRLIVYPAVIRKVQNAWAERFGHVEAA